MRNPAQAPWRKFPGKIPLFLLLSLVARPVLATGNFGPSSWLDNGGEAIEMSPEFYWELEVRRLAQEFHPSEKLVRTPRQAATDEVELAGGSDNEKAKDEIFHSRAPFNWQAERDEFADALKTARIKPSDPAEATRQHEAARTFLESIDETVTDPLPPEFDSEFANYHKGADAFRRGKATWDAAAAAWENLLKRPPEERHYRSTWAAFMRGKLGLKRAEPDTAKWFRLVRSLAKEGYADSLSLAADSYGWEARAELRAGKPAAAAPLYLTQLALGDDSAIVSLKALVPDRQPVEGMLNYGPEPEDIEQLNPEEKEKLAAAQLQKLREAAVDPLLRRLVTVHILATASYFDAYPKDALQERASRWVKVLSELKPGKVQDAEYIGWVAYNAGNYPNAEKWLKLSDPDTIASRWLKTKLLWRGGKVQEAAKQMAQAWEQIMKDSVYSKAAGSGEDEFILYPSGRPFFASASGNLAGINLTRGEFVSSLDIFVKGQLWEDAAFVAERVLTTGELKKYVDNLPPKNPAAEQDEKAKLSWILARKLTRQDHYTEALPYLPDRYQPVLTAYMKALEAGADEKLQKMERAKAWFTAAWLARYDGMELMGTEGAPDSFESEGSFESIDIAGPRLKGTYAQQSDDEKTVARPLTLKASENEKKRLKGNRVQPETRFHYRVIAGSLAYKAAQMLPDSTEELADVLNMAGNWTKDRDEKFADRCYSTIERRCPKTEIGQAVIKQHWFVDMPGPWSQEQEEAHAKLLPSPQGLISE